MSSVLDDGRILWSREFGTWYAASKRAYPDKWDFLEAVYEYEIENDLFEHGNGVQGLDDPIHEIHWLTRKPRDVAPEIMAEVMRRYDRITDGWLVHRVNSDWFDPPGPFWEGVDGPGRGHVPCWDLNEG